MSGCSKASGLDFEWMYLLRLEVRIPLGGFPIKLGMTGGFRSFPCSAQECIHRGSDSEYESVRPGMLWTWSQIRLGLFKRRLSPTRGRQVGEGRCGFSLVRIPCRLYPGDAFPA